MPTDSQSENRRLDETKIYAEQGLDYKYEQIFGDLEVDYVPVTVYGFVSQILRPLDSGTDYYYHIRYLRWRGHLLTLPMYLVVIALCLVRGVTIVWSCHNVVGHTIPDERYNRILRSLIGWAATDIIVFHESLRPYLHPHEDKVHVACFGSFQEFFRDHSTRNPDFEKRYREWVKQRGIDGPDVVFVGVYTRHKNIEWLVDHLRAGDAPDGLVIAPGYPEPDGIQHSEQQPENLLLAADQKVIAEVDDVLQLGMPIGYVAHDNLSVPTSIYVYASYGIPMIAYDVDPLAPIVREHQLGAVFSRPADIGVVLERVRAEYETYRAHTAKFLETCTWERSRAVHASVFRLPHSTARRTGEPDERSDGQGATYQSSKQT
jgi:glycosyltransferase involved in cell wall biosynthesis